MKGSGKRPAVAILGTGSVFWRGRVQREDVFEISRACQRTPTPAPPPVSGAFPVRCTFAGLRRALALRVGTQHSHTDLRGSVIAMSPELPFILFLSGIVLGFFAGVRGTQLRVLSSPSPRL